VLTHWLDLAPSGHRVSMLARANDLIAHNGVAVLVVTDAASLARYYDFAVLDVLSVPRWSIDTWLAVTVAAGWTQVHRRDLGDGRSVVIAAR
jgi:hypothetical protein